MCLLTLFIVMIMGAVLNTCNPSTQEVQAGGSGVQSQSWLHSEVEASLSYMTHCLKSKIKNKVVGVGRKARSDPGGRGRWECGDEVIGKESEVCFGGDEAFHSGTW